LNCVIYVWYSNKINSTNWGKNLELKKVTKKTKTKQITQTRALILPDDATFK